MNVKLRRNIIRLFSVLLYIALIVLLINIGKGHTIYIFNQKFISSTGEEINALYTCKILNATEKGSFVNFLNQIWIKLFNKKLYQDQILTYAKGVPGQIVVPWHKKKVIFEFYDGINLVKRIEKQVSLDPGITQYVWNLSALYAENPEWSDSYLIEETSDSE